MQDMHDVIIYISTLKQVKKVLFCPCFIVLIITE